MQPLPFPQLSGSISGSSSHQLMTSAPAHTCPKNSNQKRQVAAKNVVLTTSNSSLFASFSPLLMLAGQEIPLNNRRQYVPIVLTLQAHDYGDPHCDLSVRPIEYQAQLRKTIQVSLTCQPRDWAGTLWNLSIDSRGMHPQHQHRWCPCTPTWEVTILHQWEYLQPVHMHDWNFYSVI